MSVEAETLGVDAGPLEPKPLVLKKRLLELAGEVDVENRYQSTVLVTALSGTQEVMGCSGVALSPLVVLTAGHCVCAHRQVNPPQGEPQTLIDASACAERANVETLTYKPQREERASLRGSRMRFHRGRVQPHPDLNITLDSQGHVSTSHADLALVILDEPLEFPGLPLADVALHVADSVIIVGYGYDEEADVLGPDRRWCMNTITRLPTARDERVLIQQPGGHPYRQDSGGPCLLLGEKGPVLVGISERWLGEGAAFTNLHDYRDWLREQLRYAEPGTPEPR